ncbi:oxidoreductase [Aureococcus anophagefferens]|nr:oxidoreductase [Aureococcus anophagefferens]
MANKIGCNLMLALLALLVVGCDAAIVTRRGFALLVVVGCDAAIVTRRDFVGGGAAAAAASRPTAASAAVDARAALARGGLAVPRVGFGLYKTKPEETAAPPRARSRPACATSTRPRPTATRRRSARRFAAAQSASSRPRSRPAAARATRQSRRRSSRVRAGLRRAQPLAPRAERLAAYEQLLDARRDGLCGAVGVANFGVRHLGELPEPPALVQLELSPYNQRRAEAAWATKNGAVVTCAAWSKLSGAYNWGSDAAFKALNACCKAHAATKAQVLVRWAVQRGFAPLPRSTAADAAQRLAIAQNAAAGVEDGDSGAGTASRAEMKALDALRPPASGKLGRTDGWTADDVAGGLGPDHGADG